MFRLVEIQKKGLARYELALEFRGVEPYACFALPTDAEINAKRTSHLAGVHNKVNAWSLTRRELLTTPLELYRSPISGVAT
jgi:hypothetical protein